MEKTLMKVDQFARVLKLLGDKTRLSIVNYVSITECCVCELVELIEASQPAISQHLRKLKDANLVNERRKGQWIFYSINKEHPAYSLIMEIVQHLPDGRKDLEQLSNHNFRIICE